LTRLQADRLFPIGRSRADDPLDLLDGRAGIALDLGQQRLGAIRIVGLQIFFHQLGERLIGSRHWRSGSPRLARHGDL
jgi:hypothetical protein